MPDEDVKIQLRYLVRRASTIKRIYRKKAVHYANYLEVFEYPRTQIILTRKGVYFPRKEDSIRSASSVSRARRRLYRLVLANDNAHGHKGVFLTLTYKQHITDLSVSALNFKKFIKRLKYLCKRELLYIAVPEYHADKQAIHFHVLMNNYQGNIVKSVNPYTGKQVIQKGKPVFNIKSYTLGFTNMTYIVHKGKTASYISKYITKSGNNPLFNAMHLLRISQGFPREFTARNEYAEYFIERMPISKVLRHEFSVDNQFLGTITKQWYA